MQDDASLLLTSRDALARLRATTIFGLLAGAALFLIEWIERLIALGPSLHGAGEVLRFVVLLAPTVLFAGLFGLALGCAQVALESLRRAIAMGLARATPKLSGGALEIASLGIAAVVAGLGFKLFAGRVLYKAEAMVKDTIEALAPVAPFIAARWKPFYVASLIALFLAAMGAHLATFRPWKGASRRLVAAGAIAFAAVVVLAYLYDAGPSFGHNEIGLHHPLVAAYTLAATLGAGLATRAGSTMEWVNGAGSRRSRRFLAAATLIGAGSFAFALAGMDQNQNVKALLWNRSVIARRCYEIARALADRDRDGYASILGGGDCDDRNPRVSPSAAEIPGNGVDDNCIGGDLPKDAPRPRVPAPGELIAAPGPAPQWTPGHAPPPGAVDVGSAGAAGESPAGDAADRARRPHIFLLSIDALRGDHTTMGGYARATTPNLARYAQKGLTFTRAIAQGTNTGHSFVSLLRSSYADAMFDRNVPTLTRLLKDAGYRTASVNARRLDDWIRQRRWHMYRPTMIEDFDVLHLDGAKAWTAAELTDQMIRYVDGFPAGRPEFVWVHYNDVHNPRVDRPEHGFGKGDVDVYDNVVAYTDAHVGRFLDHLQNKGILDHSVVFIMADHGEGFLEHGTIDHGNKPYQDNAHVPLVVLAPGVAGAVIADPVALVDVTPTALARAGLPIPDVYRGIDLVAAARGGGFPRRAIVSETPRNVPSSPFYAWAWIDWPYKYLHDPKATTSELYDLASDPGEVHNLAARDPRRAAAMRAALGRWLDLETARRAPQ